MSPDPIETILDVEIGMAGGCMLHLDVARPAPIPAHPMPVVLWIHGGGWRKGSHHDENPAVYLAAKGYFVASVEYRLSGEAIWPAQLEDCQRAVRWLRDHADEYHLDLQRIGCWGHSAGGHLAACLGTMSDEGNAIQAIVDYCGPVDLSTGSYRLPETQNEVHDADLVQLFGVPFAGHEKLWRHASPICRVSPTAPPFLIIHGDADRTVPMLQSQRFVAALQEAGVPAELITVRGGPHSMMVPPGDPDKSALQAAILDFFDKHLARSA